MKRGFSIGEALGAPFVLLRRRPFSLFVWGLATLALMAVAWALILPMMSSFSPEMMQPGGQMDEASMMAFNRMNASVNGLDLLNMFVGLVVYTAIMRATLSPARGDAFAFLRIGMGEVRVAVSVIAITIGACVVCVVLVLLGAALAFGVASLGKPMVVLIMVGYGIVVTLAVLWMIARVILIVPLSLLQHTFAFDEGWALGKGQAWRLIATAFLSWIVLVLVEVIGAVILVAAAFGIAVAMGFVMPDVATLHTPQAWMEALRPLQIPAAIVAIPACLLFGLLQAIWAAPLASAALQLVGAGGPEGGLQDGGTIGSGRRAKTRSGKAVRPPREPFPDLALPVVAQASDAHAHDVVAPVQDAHGQGQGSDQLTAEHAPVSEVHVASDDHAHGDHADRDRPTSDGHDAPHGAKSDDGH